MILTRPRANIVGFWVTYTLLPPLFPSEPTPAPEGGFRRFVIKFCGSTYNTPNHLSIAPHPNPFSSLYFIICKLFFRTIKTKFVLNSFYIPFFEIFSVFLNCVFWPETFQTRFSFTIQENERIFSQNMN